MTSVALTILYTAEPLLMIVAMAALLRSREHRRFPALFAYLAVRSLKCLPLSVPGTTGVPEPLSGGHAYIPKSGPTETVKKLIETNPGVLFGYQKIYQSSRLGMPVL